MLKILFVSIVLFVVEIFKCSASPEPDTSFKQALSVKYNLPDSLQGSVLKKVVVDYNDIVYVLTDKG
jgi:hypothetical protein